ncbi:preprotein translocase subunit YajC [Desulfotomaculum copahuensis]|uniref:Preprotein translocase subunit YajC n=1 Tax=Desulfotomaculum copahuensis TaxID=1838280 RepID=A0A1B7LHG5_9FIRM|nr:preprotein translocase subunit YajC [Desulfotomaculum copahuensis]OAT85740.1 preprotein translocase subunit YajC [Desulfotomaculum copahuensis]
MGLNQTTGTLLYVVALFALLYFLMIRPQQQRQKKHQQMLRDVKVNDSIVTAGGIYATVVKIKEDSLIVRVADGVRIEILKNAIAQVREREPEETGEKE